MTPLRWYMLWGDANLGPVASTAEFDWLIYHRWTQLASSSTEPIAFYLGIQQKRSVLQLTGDHK